MSVLLFSRGWHAGAMISAGQNMLHFRLNSVAFIRCRECSLPTRRSHAEIPREYYVWFATL
jgi:hypothetical protein